MRKENLKNLVHKEKNVVKMAEKEFPGPGTYDIKYNYTEEKLPMVR